MTKTFTEAAKRTAITRPRDTAAKPIRLLVDQVELEGEVLHHGCGKDKSGTRLLQQQPHVTQVTEYDPNYTVPLEEHTKFDTIVSAYVACVLPPGERQLMMASIKRRLKPDGMLYMASRGKGDKLPEGETHEDGVITSAGTFQSTHTADELAHQLEDMGFKDTKVLHGTPSSQYIIVAARR